MAAPFSAAALQLRVTWVWPTWAVRLPGAAGGATGVAVAGVAAGPAPRVFTARTWKVYVVPLVKPVTV